MNSYDNPTDEDAVRVGVLTGLYFLGSCMTCVLQALHHHQSVQWQALAIAFCVRAVIELPAAFLLLTYRIEQSVGSPCCAYFIFGSPLLGLCVALWTWLQPGGYWMATDLALRFLTLIVPMLLWVFYHQVIIPKTGGYGGGFAKYVPSDPSPAPAYTYTPSPAATPALDRELARIEAEAREYNLDPDLVAAEKARAREEFGTR